MIVVIHILMVTIVRMVMTSSIFANTRTQQKHGNEQGAHHSEIYILFHFNRYNLVYSIFKDICICKGEYYTIARIDYIIHIFPADAFA